MLVPSGTQWNKETEVVVVGYGLAGAVAAITAREKTDRIMIIEKQDADSHYSNSSMSGGFIMCPSDVNGSIEYMKALCQVDESARWTDMETIRVWAKYTAQNKDWLENLGGQIKFISKVAEYPQLPGADSIEVWQYPGTGWRMMKLMYEQVNARQIEVWYQTLAQRLLTNEKGEIIGVKAIKVRGGQQEEVSIKARKAVILCSGGFEGNEEMKLQYLRVYPIYFTGGSLNTGEGITMAQEVGADLWHMNCCSGRLILKFPDFSVAFPLNPSGGAFGKHMFRSLSEKSPAGFIIVDKFGRRYMSENFKAHAAWYQLTVYDANRLEYPRVPSYYIFDRRRMEHGPLILMSRVAGRYRYYNWSRDNKAELKRGWIVNGDTITELANRIAMSGKTLNKTVRIWNKHCEEGKDLEFGRNPMELIPLDSPPFYAVKLFPGGPNTQGGPRRNSRAQVLNPFGNPIPGLYAAGECGSIYGMLYPATGGNLAECIAFGRIAGENAAGEAEKA